jgi:transposase
MDELHGKYKQQIKQISYEHTLKILGGAISVVFYDVTTIYFEAEKEDELRITGFSKDGKHQNPQIVLGLLVSAHGYPLAFEIYEGNKFEGHTMIPVLESFRQTYQIEDLIVIADAGLMSKENILELSTQGMKYILGANCGAGVSTYTSIIQGDFTGGIILKLGN